jgi:hypothetical protein
MLSRASKSVNLCLRSLHTKEPAIANPVLQCSFKPLAKATLVARADGQEEMASPHEFGTQFTGYAYSIGCSECKRIMTLRYKDLNGSPGCVFEKLKRRDPNFTHLLSVALNSAQRLNMNDLVDLSFEFRRDRARITKGYTAADWRIGCPGAEQERKSFTDQTS